MKLIINIYLEKKIKVFHIHFVVLIVILISNLLKNKEI